MTNFFSDKRIVVTGASSGIGAQAALLLNKSGATVIGIGRDIERLAAVKERAAHPECLHVEVKDLAEDIQSLPHYLRKLRDQYGELYGMVLCAGVSELMPASLIDSSAAKRLFDINYFVPLMLAKGFGDRRVNAGAGSVIVAVASIAAQVAEAGQAVYAGSKAALIASMKALSREFAARQLRVNCVSPAMVDTPMTRNLPASVVEGLSVRYPRGFGHPDEVAREIVNLLSEDTLAITGENKIMSFGAY